MSDFPKRSILKQVGTWLVNNDNELVIKGLREGATGTTVNDAALTFSVYDATEDPLTGGQSISMPYVSGSNGNYRGILPGTVGLTATTEYRVVVTGSNYNFERQGLIQATVGT